MKIYTDEPKQYPFAKIILTYSGDPEALGEKELYELKDRVESDLAKIGVRGQIFILDRDVEILSPEDIEVDEFDIILRAE